LHLVGDLLSVQDCTILAVVTDRGGPGHREILSNWNGAAGNAGTSLFLGLTGVRDVRFSDALTVTEGLTRRREPFLLVAGTGPEETTIFQNRQALVTRSGPLPARNLSTAWVIGQQGNIEGEFWDGELAELQVFDRAITEAERLILSKRLAERYGIPLATPAHHLPSAEEQALASLAHVLLNSNEFLYID
jgi:hypothetical protein